MTHWQSVISNGQYWSVIKDQVTTVEYYWNKLGQFGVTYYTWAELVKQQNKGEQFYLLVYANFLQVFHKKCWVVKI